MLSDVISASITHLEVKLAASAKCMVSTFVTWSAPFKLCCPDRTVLAAGLGSITMFDYYNDFDYMSQKTLDYDFDYDYLTIFFLITITISITHP